MIKRVRLLAIVERRKVRNMGTELKEDRENFPHI